MAAPVGHLVSALALLNAMPNEIIDEKKFLLGTQMPDIRYITDIKRSQTHILKENSLEHVFSAKNSFEKGRRFHVYIDRKREIFMRKKNAYKFVKNGPLSTQMLKITEDHILVKEKLHKHKDKTLFTKVAPEELEYGIDEKAIKHWHKILSCYLDQDSFTIWRYLKSLLLFQNAYKKDNGFFSYIYNKARTIGFFIYAYFQVTSLSKNPKLKKIVKEFYTKELTRLFKLYKQKMREKPKMAKVHDSIPP